MSSSYDEVDTPARSSPKTNRLIIACLLVVLGVVAVSVVLITMDQEDNDDDSGSSHHMDMTCEGQQCGQYGAVATTNEHATKIGMDILKKGGNAYDAAIAVQFALAVAEPTSTGLGGGCFVVFYHNETHKVYAIDGREEAPEKFHGNIFCKDPDCFLNASCTCEGGALDFVERETGGLSVGVPGVVSAMERLFLDRASLPLADLINPSIDLAKKGFKMYQQLHDRIESNRERLARFPASAKLFLRDGHAPAIGTTWKNPDLAKTLKSLIDDEIWSFYAGAIAEDILDAVHDAVNNVTGRYGVMEMMDIAGYRAVYREPTSISYRDGKKIYGMPYPSSGGSTLALMLNMIENFDIASLLPDSVEYLHRLIEVQNIAFADRSTYMADADWVDIPQSALVNKSYATHRVVELVKQLQANNLPIPASTLEELAPYLSPGEDIRPMTQFATEPLSARHGTTHLSIADKFGNVVAMTTTIEDNFGSAVVVPGRGFLLNNELTDFSGTKDDPNTGLPYANCPAGGKKVRKTAIGVDNETLGGKRPLSSMTPTIVMETVHDHMSGQMVERPSIAIGSPGGSRIIGQVFNALVPLLDLGLTSLEATSIKRIVARNSAPALAEVGVDETVFSALEGRGFQLQNYSSPLGFVQTVQIFYDHDHCGHGVPMCFATTADTSRLPSALALAF